jgi:S1-C subfamily serine protease
VGVLVLSACGGEKKLSQTELIEKSKPSVVRIRGKESGGSGVVIDAQRSLVLTNAHVAVGLTGMKAVVGDNEATETPAQLVAAAPCEDLAVIRLVNKPPNLQAMKIGKSADVKAGERVTVLGYPGSFQEDRQTGAAGQAQKLVATDGSVSSANIAVTPDDTTPRFASVIQHQATINHGNSGGPLVNEKGELVGINTLTGAGSDEGGQTQGQYYSISIDRVQSLLPQLKAGKSQAYVGWDLTPITTVDLPQVFASDPDFGPMGGARLGQRVQQVLQRNQEQGMYVLNSQTGSAAREADVVYGDMVLSLEGQPVTKMQDVCDILQSKAPGEKVRLKGVQVNSGRTIASIDRDFSSTLTVK